MGNKLFRLATLTVAEVLPRIAGSTKPDTRPLVCGVPCHLSGLRLFTFKEKGVDCVTCGVKGAFFAVERPQGGPAEGQTYHLNLYALGYGGEEVLMTHDHILARSLGGRNHIDNTQPMCETCNCKKGNTEEKEAKAIRAYYNSAEFVGPKIPALSKRKKTALAAARRKQALIKHLKSGATPSGALSVGIKLDDPEAEALRMKFIAQGLRGEQNIKVDIGKDYLAQENISGAVLIKRILETGTTEAPQSYPSVVAPSASTGIPGSQAGGAS